ncbi:MAG: hypothetical protein COW71_02965 [Ignavibacteriales bacterium CG18_big_fil_WC_8_21_14_2_50_31_20]|nr:MAG: hypothetical protein COW71_02965 [Ignavibacteriales bacterium CG18_big_fil_WC_8_21_14_2_50_31_20]
MGYSTLIDILGSIMIGGILLLILLRLNDAAVANSFQYNADLIIQKNLVEIVTLLEFDLRKIGYCANWQALPDPTKAIIAVDTNSITYLTDLPTIANPYGDGIVDTLRYYLGAASELSQTPNPRDRMLYRRENSGLNLGSNLGVTQFEFKFFDTFGALIPFPISVPGEIQSMQIDLALEDVAAYDEQYRRVFWRQIRLAARNLGNR